MAIFKYPLELKGEQELVMPERARILAVKEQFNGPVLYAEVRPEADIVKRRIRLVATAMPALGESHWTYLDTVLLNKGTYVLHVFIEKRER